MKKNVWFALLAVVLCAALTVLGAMIICPKCGYEQPENAAICSHCGAALPKPPPKITTEKPITVKPTWLIAANDDRHKATDASAHQQWWLAWFYARNAYALNTMTESTNSARAVQLTGMMENFEKQVRSSTTTCPLCRGTGHTDVHIKTSSGRDQVMHSDSKLCERCNGAGTLPVVVRADLLNHSRAQIKRDYDALQKDRGWEAVEGAWLPPDLARDLSLKERVQLLRALGSPCLDCAGMGILACTKCDGAGWIKCSNLDCVSGTMPCPDCNGTGKPNLKAARAAATTTTSTRYASMGAFCQTCSGTGRIVCRICKGQASLVCQSCNGHAVLVCKTCNGNGQNPICSTCKGDGVIVCRRCQGTGKIREAVCPDCKGEGETLCSNCKGVGRVAKH